MNRILLGLGIISGLILGGCAGQNGGSGSSNNSNASASTSTANQQVEELDTIPVPQGNIDLSFGQVFDVEDLEISGLPPVNVNGAIVTLPPLNYARVAGIGTFTLVDSSGTSTTVQQLGVSAVFSGSSAAGAACLTTALQALNDETSLDIKGEGALVQIPYPLCQPNDPCAEPLAINGGATFTAGVQLSAEGETAAIISAALSVDVNISSLPPGSTPTPEFIFKA